jgi:hypothetical protein
MAERIARSKTAKITISTILLLDRIYETAIVYKELIYPVEWYTKLEDAKAGHKRWEDLAPNLKTILTSDFGCDNIREIIIED